MSGSRDQPVWDREDKELSWMRVESVDLSHCGPAPHEECSHVLEVCGGWVGDGGGKDPKVIVTAWKCHRGRAVRVEVDESLESSHTTVM